MYKCRVKAAVQLQFYWFSMKHVCVCGVGLEVEVGGGGSQLGLNQQIAYSHWEKRKPSLTNPVKHNRK